MNKLESINNKIDELRKEIIKLEEEKKQIKNYRSIIILRANTTLKDFEDIEKTIKSIIEITFWENLGVKKLAYEIRKEKEGFYIQFDFVGTGTDIQEIEEYYRNNDNIIKFLTIINEED